MHIRSLLVATLLFGQMAFAQEMSGKTGDRPPGAPQTLEEAKAMRAKADTMRTEAEQRHETERNACYSKFLVNDCLESARKNRTRALLEARDIEKVARDFEREAHRQEVDAREAGRAAEAAQREAGQQAQGERYREEEAKKATERERKLAEKEKQAAEGRRRSEAEQAARQAKLEKRAQDDARRAARQGGRSTSEAAER